jgi:Zn-dependent protease
LDFLQKINLASVAIQFAVLLFSLSVHEAAHAWMADRLGDYTARYLGRVTLNPLAHVDPIGTVLFPILQMITRLPLIGWAKPVPVNPVHLKNPQRDQIWISLAGPGANLVTAALCFILLALLKLSSAKASGLMINMIITYQIPESKSILAPILGILFFGMVINLALAIFNFIPIPPLDGHWMLYAILPYNAGRMLERAGSYGFILLYGLMFLGIFKFIFIPVNWVRSLLLLL